MSDEATIMLPSSIVMLLAVRLLWMLRHRSGNQQDTQHLARLCSFRSTFYFGCWLASALPQPVVAPIGFFNLSDPKHRLRLQAAE